MLLPFAGGGNEHRRQDAKGGLVVVAALSLQGFKATQALERSISGMQVCWRCVLYEASFPLPEAQLWERAPGTLLPQHVFEYFTWSNFGKSLIADEEHYWASVNCVWGRGKNNSPEEHAVFIA